MQATLPSLGLDNCADEPIHIPGRIQSHGVLVAFDAALRVSHVSANAAALLGALAPALGQHLDETCFHADPAMREMVRECLSAGGDEVQPMACEVRQAGRAWELVAHRNGETLLLELEPADAPGASFTDDAFKGHRALNRMKRLRSVDELLAAAVEEVRRLTGFDRVMAYRFLHDDSGEVVAEARDPALEPLLGRRYPASDIPPQARRLYVLHTLRNIADVASDAVPLLARADCQAPLDLSHSVLRSVSPVHIEYLGNMGVAASMSISVVIQGRLWGMLACHHMRPRHVSYRLRSACDVLAHILAAGVQGLLAGAHAERLDAAATVRARVIARVLHADDGVLALQSEAAALCAMFGAHAMVLAWQGRQLVSDDVATLAARELAGWLVAQDAGPSRMLVRATLDGLPETLRAGLGGWCGMLALRFADTQDGWLVLLRKEEVETIAWGGRPDKVYAHGPLGPRLTPRGSFELWKQEVRGRCVPWGAAELDMASSLLGDLARAVAARSAEVESARARLLAMLGHGATGAALVEAETPGRTESLLAQLLDAAAWQAGGGPVLQPAPLDLCALVRDVLREQGTLHPAARFVVEMPAALVLQADMARLQRIVASLVGNACRHGVADEAVVVQLHHHADAAVLEISNVGAEIPAPRLAMLLDPFRAGADVLRAGADGLGLGLYIARQTARAHGGELEYAYAEPYVLFTLRLPLARA